MKGKKLSQISKIIACLIALTSLVVNAIAKSEIMPVKDACFVGGFIFVVFLPIDVSIWIEILKAYVRKTIPADGKDDVN